MAMLEKERIGFVSFPDANLINVYGDVSFQRSIDEPSKELASMTMQNMNST